MASKSWISFWDRTDPRQTAYFGSFTGRSVAPRWSRASHHDPGSGGKRNSREIPLGCPERNRFGKSLGCWAGPGLAADNRPEVCSSTAHKPLLENRVIVDA